MRRAVIASLVATVSVPFTATAVLAQSVNVGADTTITTNVTGTPGANGGADAAGSPGVPGINWVADDVDVAIDPGLTIAGGAAGAGGTDASNDGGNDGGLGGFGLFMQTLNGTLVTSSTDFIYGGAGGDGSDGGVGGASDTRGGLAGNGGAAIYVTGAGAQISLIGTSVTGGAGGNSGDVGDTSAANTWSGRKGGNGGNGIEAAAGGSISLANTQVIGGSGGNAGDTADGQPNGNGGRGGYGIALAGTVLSIDASSSVKGGAGGAAGGGGIGGFAGAGGIGVQGGGAGTSITNFGFVQGGDNAAGVQLGGNADLIGNYGTIEGQGDHGVWLIGTSVLADLHNQQGGLIKGVNAVFVDAGTRVLTFTNDGTLTSTSVRAIDVAGQVGVIVNTGAINGGIRVSSDFAGMGLTNTNGVIYGHVDFNGTGDHTFTLQGSGGIEGMLTGGSGIDTLNLQGGSITGAIDFGGGVNQLNVDSTFNSNAIIGATGGGLVLNIGGTGVLNAGHTVSDVLNIDVAGGGRIHIGNSTVTGSAALNNQGAVAVDGDAQLNMGTMTAGGAFVFGINELSESPRLVLSAGALDFTGATLQIELQPSNAPLTSGSNWQVAQGVGAASGITNGQQLADNSALLNFFVYRGDALFDPSFANQVYVQALAALLADIASLGDDPNAIALGGALDTIGLNGDNAIDQLMLKLALLPTDAAINDVLDSLLPETDGVAYDLATDAGDQVLDVASRRLDGLRGTSMASLEYKVAGLGNAGLRNLDRKGVELWGQAFGRIVDQRRRTYNDGYEADGYGFAAGIDTPVEGGASLIGAAFAYAQTNADGSGVNRTVTDVDSYQLVVYGDHLFDNRTYAKAMLGYGWHANDVARHDVGGAPGPTLASSYDARQFTARAETGRPYQMDRNLTLVPHVTANYAYYDPDAYSEAPATGGEVPVGGTLALNVAPESLESFRLGLGVLARWNVELDADALLQPEMRLNYRRELIGDRFETTSEFVGAPGLASFKTLGVDPPRDILDVGVGALLSSAGGIDIRANYDLEFKDAYTAHSGYLRASVSF